MARFATKYDRVLLLIRQDGRCAGCGHQLAEFEVDHLEPWADSKDADLWNLQALCATCHRRKTSGDISRIASRRRRRSKAAA